MTTAAHPHAHGHSHGAPAPAKASGETTRAIVFSAAGELGCRDVSLREAAPDEVTVDVAYSSISSGTERLIFGGTLPGFPMLRFPLVPGYEAVGTVARVGPEVRDVAIGDAVFVGGSMCYTDALGLFGGNAARLHKKGAQVVPLHGIPLARAPLLALAATSLHGIRRLGDVRGKRVAVLGLGAIGQFAARFLANAGAHVLCAEIDASRLAQTPDGCASVDLSGTSIDAVAHDLDAVVEATGRSQEIAASARALRAGGDVLLLSYYDELRTPYVDLFVKEVNLLVAREWAHEDLLAARDLLASGAVGIGALADHVVPATDYEAAYHTAFHDPRIAKVILQWA
jgi:3-hydroxyethyl bacteriochlorophyllide a dehydrogenase